MKKQGLAMHLFSKLIVDLSEELTTDGFCLSAI